MFIAQAFKVKHEFWRYLLGSLLVAIGAIIGQIPLMGAITYKTIKDGGSPLDINEDTMYSALDSNLFLFLVLLSFVIAFVGLWVAVKTLHQQKMVTVVTSRKSLDWKRILFAFVFWGVISSGMVLLDYFYLSPEGYEFNFEPSRFLILVIIAVALIPIQTSLEEYVFRGYLMQGFGTATKEKYFPFAFLISFLTIPMFIILNIKESIGYSHNGLLLLVVILVGLVIFQIIKKNSGFESNAFNKLRNICQRNWIPLVITSSIFGLLHIANPEVGKLGYGLMVYYIGTGLFLGIMTLMDEGTELALGFHAANNLFTAILVTSDWTAFQTHSILKDVAEPKLDFIDMVFPVFVMFPIILFIFSKVYKWTDWKDKLFGEVHEPPAEDYKIIGD